MENNIFKTLVGAADGHEDYEDLFVAHLILELITSKNVEDFELSSNDIFGTFDDVVVKIESFDGYKQNYALQLKLSGKPLTEQNLARKIGDFSIKKYFEEFTQLKKDKSDVDFDSFRWILFTNRRFDGKNGQKIRLDGEDFDIEIVECQPDTFLMESVDEGRCYKLGADVTQVPSEYQNFFDNFFLYTNQPNDDRIKKKVFNKLQETFCCEESSFSQYLNFITNWMSIQGDRKEKLTKTMTKQIVAMCLLSPFIQPVSFNTSSDDKINQNYALLRKAICKFKISFFREENVGRLAAMLAAVKNELTQTDISEVNKIGMKFRVISHNVKNVNELSDEECYKLAWLMHMCPLIVVENQCVLQAISLCENMDFILLYKKSPAEIPGVSKFENLSDLKEDSNLYHDILKNFKCSLQGKKKINLQTLIGESYKIGNLITTNELVMMADDSFVIGEEKDEFPEIYIERSLSRHVIDYRFLTTIDENTIVVISNMKKYNDHVNPMNSTNIEKFLYQARWKTDNEDIKKSIYISEKACSQRMFEDLCNKISGRREFHHFRNVDGKLEWIRSKRGVHCLHQFRIGNCFVSEEELFSGEDVNNLNIICENPGTGKSTLMKNLKRKISPSFWTILICPKDHSAHFREKGDYFFEFKKYILNTKLKEYEPFDSKWFKVLFEENRIDFIWDGLDEISGKTLNTVVSIIAQLSVRNVRQWITSRNSLRAALENKFEIFSRTIRPFDLEEQEGYLKRSLTCSDGEINEIFCRIKNCIEMFSNDQILGIPLQIYMFTELLRQNSKKYNAVINNLFTITDLYYHFVQEKFNIYNKTRNDGDDITYEKNDRIDSYEKVAFKVYFQNNLPCDVDCEEFLREIREGKDPVGIITGVSEENVPNFLHNSYVEYFAASYLSKHPEVMSKLSEIIFNENHNNIRFLFDSILAQGCPAHLAVLYKNPKDIESYNKDELISKDRGGRNALQLACSYGRKYPALTTKTEGIFYKKYTVYASNEKKIEKESPEYRNILEQLMDVCNPDEKDAIFNLNSFEYADRGFCAFPLALLSDKRRINYNTIKNFNLPLILYYSVIFDFANILDTFRQVPFLCTSTDFSLLHLSADYGSLKCFKKLIVSYNYKDIFQSANERQRLILLSCQNGHFDITKFLIENGVDVNSSFYFEESLLHVACQKGNCDVAKLLIEHGAKVHSSRFREAPLVLAFKHGHAETVKLLTDHGADVNSVNNDKETPLHLACRKGDSETAKVLIALGAKVTSVNRYGETPLHLACELKMVEVIKSLIERGASVNAANSSHRTPLFLAWQNGSNETLKLLIEHGADVNSVRQYHDTPLLHLAWQTQNYGMVRLLIEGGADVNSVNQKRETLLYLACKRENVEIVKLLVKRGADRDVDKSLRVTCERRNCEIVRLLVGHGASVNSVDKSETPLSLACRYRSYDIAKFLIERGANVNSTDRWNDRPLHLACRLEMREIVQLLIEHGATVNSLDKGRNAPLHFACGKKNAEIVKILLEHGADVDLVNEDYETPLYLACLCENHEIFMLLIEHGVNVKLMDKYHKTPIFSLCKSGDNEKVRVLIEHGANVNLTVPNATLLHLACEFDNYELVKLLTEHGAEVNSSSLVLSTPLYLACVSKNKQIVKFLIEHGANVNAVISFLCDTILHSIYTYDNEITKLLIDHGADVNSKNVEGNTPLHVFSGANKNGEMVKLLIQHGADINAINKIGNTPLHHAYYYENHNIVKLLIDNGAQVDIENKNGQTPRETVSV